MSGTTTQGIFFCSRKSKKSARNFFILQSERGTISEIFRAQNGNSFFCERRNFFAPKEVLLAKSSRGFFQKNSFVESKAFFKKLLFEDKVRRADCDFVAARKFHIFSGRNFFCRSKKFRSWDSHLSKNNRP